MTSSRRVVIGADTHQDMIHLAAIAESGELLGDAEFPTSAKGYDAAVTWARDFGGILIAGVEGTSRHGAGLTRVLRDEQIEVAYVSRTDRTADPLNAYAAARAIKRFYGTVLAARAGDVPWGDLADLPWGEPGESPVQIRDPWSPGPNPPASTRNDPSPHKDKPNPKVRKETTESS